MANLLQDDVDFGLPLKELCTRSIAGSSKSMSWNPNEEQSRQIGRVESLCEKAATAISNEKMAQALAFLEEAEKLTRPAVCSIPSRKRESLRECVFSVLNTFETRRCSVNPVKEDQKLEEVIGVQKPATAAKGVRKRKKKPEPKKKKKKLKVFQFCDDCSLSDQSEAPATNWPHPELFSEVMKTTMGAMVESEGDDSDDDKAKKRKGKKGKKKKKGRQKDQPQELDKEQTMLVELGLRPTGDDSSGSSDSSQAGKPPRQLSNRPGASSPNKAVKRGKGRRKFGGNRPKEDMAKLIKDVHKLAKRRSESRLAEMTAMNRRRQMTLNSKDDSSDSSNTGLLEDSLLNSKTVMVTVSPPEPEPASRKHSSRHSVNSHILKPTLSFTARLPSPAFTSHSQSPTSVLSSSFSSSSAMRRGMSVRNRNNSLPTKVRRRRRRRGASSKNLKSDGSAKLLKPFSGRRNRQSVTFVEDSPSLFQDEWSSPLNLEALSEPALPLCSPAAEADDKVDDDDNILCGELIEPPDELTEEGLQAISEVVSEALQAAVVSYVASVKQEETGWAAVAMVVALLHISAEEGVAFEERLLLHRLEAISVKLCGKPLDLNAPSEYLFSLGLAAESAHEPRTPVEDESIVLSHAARIIQTRFRRHRCRHLLPALRAEKALRDFFAAHKSPRATPSPQRNRTCEAYLPTAPPPKSRALRPWSAVIPKAPPALTPSPPSTAIPPIPDGVTRFLRRRLDVPVTFP